MPRHDTAPTWSVTAIVVALVLICSASGTDARAHPNHGQTLGERYVTLDITSEEVRVVYGLTYPARTSAKVRQAADADRDGLVSPAEADQHEHALQARIRDLVSLELDGTPAPLSWGSPFIAGLEGPGARGPVTGAVVGRASLSARTARFVLRDRAEFDGVYRTTVRIALSPELTLLRGGEGTTPRMAQRRVAFLDLPEEGPPPARVVTAVVDCPECPEEPAPPWSTWGLELAAGVVALLSLVAGLVAVRRRRRGVTELGKDSER